MEQQQVQQLQLQAAVDSLKRVIDGLLQEGMNLSAQVSVLGTQLQESLKKEEMLKKLVASLQEQQKSEKESQKTYVEAPTEASNGIGLA